jgi:uncharacterized membrane protein HdeD (DUF308 family)
MIEEIKYNQDVKTDSVTNFMLNFLIVLGIALIVNGLIWIILGFAYRRENLLNYWNNISGYEKQSFLFKIGLYTSLNYNLILLLVLLL